jgi:uncharacterized ubiquitin-like protein YukD
MRFFSCLEVGLIYIQVTIDLRHYTGESFDLRLSDYYSVKKVIDIVWQIEKIKAQPREGNWVRIENKGKVLPGYASLHTNGVTNGDKIVII